MEVLQNFRTVRAFGREEKEKQAFRMSMMQALRVRFSDIVDKFTDMGCWFLGPTISEFLPFLGLYELTLDQCPFQVPKLEVPSDIMPHICPYIDLALLYGRYLQFRFLKWPLIRSVAHRQMFKVVFSLSVSKSQRRSVPSPSGLFLSSLSKWPLCTAAC